ncbi:MAG: NTP transferase domain-containing protein, partial [Actinomycetes bacterium]
MAEAPELPADPLTSFPSRGEVVQPDPARSRPRPRVGVVLAAGRSERLAAVTGGGSKALLRLGGLSLVERAVRSLLAAGLERVLVVVGHDAGPVATVVGRLGRDRVRVVYADRWADGNGASLAGVQDEVVGEALFVLVTADHVFGEGGLDRLLTAGAPAVLIDPAPGAPAWAEGTRVRVMDQAVVAFGKHLDEPAIDCGAFLLPPEVFERQRQAATEGDHTLAGAVTRLAQARPLRAVALPAGCWWQDVDTPQDAKVAKVALRRSLGKDADGPVSRWLNRPLSTRLSMLLAPLRPSPDLVSLVAFAFGLAGAVLLAVGQGLAGGLLVHASSVADGVDGEVARLQLRGGPRGALLDGVLDRVGDAAILAGLGLWALDGRPPEGVLVLTVAATAGALLSMASKDRAAALGLPPAPERALGWLLGGRDGRLLLVAVGAVL